MRRSQDDGYTLVELLVVLVIIGVLTAIAFPTFLGAQRTSQDRAVQSDLRTALAAGLTHFSQDGTWDGFDATEGETIEPALVWLEGGTPVGGEISIQVHSGSDLLLVGYSDSGRFYCVAQIAGSPATSRGSASALAGVDTVAECVGGW